VKSTKADTVTLIHEGNVVVAKCMGSAFSNAVELSMSSGSCFHLLGKVGTTIPDGKKKDHITREGQLIEYFLDDVGETRLREQYQIVEETAQRDR